MPTKPRPGDDDWLRRAVVARAAALGLSGRALAQRSGVTQQHVSNFLAGRKGMGSDRLGRVLAALGLTVGVAGDG